MKEMPEAYGDPQRESAHPPGWYPDPWGRYQYRYFDGRSWTPAVATGQVQSVDHAPLHQGAGTLGAPENLVDRPLGESSPAEVRAQAAGVVGPSPVAGSSTDGATAGWGGGGTILTEPILVVNQKAKIVELNTEYTIFDREGRVLGGVTQVGQSAGKKLLRALTSLDQFMTHRLVVHDAQGNPLLALQRPAKVFKSTIVVSNPAGQEIGRIRQENVIGKIRFALESGGSRYGAIKAENWWAWNFRIEDHTGAEVARITKTWEGLLKAAFTTADNYVVQIHRPLQEPLRSLAVAAAVSVDLALKQDAQGLG